ncbi:MAG: CBS domain-containing protein [Deltaproteobacteria bacterium]|nr:CBS domain-containing protein [Deltaproteobacteria bacterium]
MLLVENRMSKSPITIKRDDSFQTALNLLRQGGVRHLPVVEGRKLVGIVTDRNLRQASPSPATSLSIYEIKYLLNKIAVEDLMVKDVITISPTATIESAAKLLFEHKIGALPVVNEKGELLGIITETDILETFVEATGLGEPSSRMEVEMDDKPGALAKVAQLIKKHTINIISVMTIPAATKGKRVVVFRLATTNPSPIRKEIEGAGYAVVSVTD